MFWIELIINVMLIKKLVKRILPSGLIRLVREKKKKVAICYISDCSIS